MTAHPKSTSFDLILCVTLEVWNCRALKAIGEAARCGRFEYYDAISFPLRQY